MRGQADERPVQRELAVPGCPLQRDDEDRRRQPWLQKQPQSFPADALKVGVLGMVGGKLLQQAGGEEPPTVRRHGDPGVAGLQKHQA